MELTLARLPPLCLLSYVLVFLLFLNKQAPFFLVNKCTY